MKEFIKNNEVELLGITSIFVDILAVILLVEYIQSDKIVSLKMIVLIIGIFIVPFHHTTWILVRMGKMVNSNLENKSKIFSLDFELKDLKGYHISNNGLIRYRIYSARTSNMKYADVLEDSLIRYELKIFNWWIPVITKRIK